jgi:hypothetical protein
MAIGSRASHSAPRSMRYSLRRGIRQGPNYRATSATTLLANRTRSKLRGEGRRCADTGSCHRAQPGFTDAICSRIYPRRGVLSFDFDFGATGSRSGRQAGRQWTGMTHGLRRFGDSCWCSLEREALKRPRASELSSRATGYGEPPTHERGLAPRSRHYYTMLQ